MPLEVIENILRYCDLDCVMACYQSCSRLKSVLPRQLVLTEESGGYFERLMEVVDPVGISMRGLGPAVPCGALGLIISSLEVDTNRFRNLTSLDLSRQVQPIDVLVTFLASTKRLESLRFLSIRPSDPVVVPLQRPEEPGPSFAGTLPSLDEAHVHLYGKVLLRTEWMIRLLLLLQRAQTLSICEVFSTERKWNSIFMANDTVLMLPRIRMLRLTDESGIQGALERLGSEGRKIRFPNLETLIIDLPQRFGSFRLLRTRLAYFPEYEVHLTERTVGARMFRKDSARHRELIHQPRAIKLDSVRLLDREDKHLSVFFNADALHDKIQLLEKTPLEHELEKHPQSIECLGISSRMAETIGQPINYRQHCSQIADIFRTKLLSILGLCGPRLRFVVVNLQLLAACTLDRSLRELLEQTPHQFPSVETLHILGTVTAASHASGSTLWSVLRHICRLFPKLKSLRMSYFYGIDPTDLKEAVKRLPLLSHLHINRMPLNQATCQPALLDMLQNAKNLKSLSLILPQLTAGQEVSEWTQAFRSRSLKYLHLELSAGGVVSMEEARVLMNQLPALEWLIIKCNPSHVIEMHRVASRSGADKVREVEHLRLENLDLPVLFPQLFGLFWFTKWEVSYFEFPNYSCDHLERFTV